MYCHILAVCPLFYIVMFNVMTLSWPGETVKQGSKCCLYQNKTVEKPFYFLFYVQGLTNWPRESSKPFSENTFCLIKMLYS